MNLNYHKMTNIYDIADVERAVNGKIYPSGCTLMPLSAAQSSPLIYHSESGPVETRYAVIQPHGDVNPEYLFTIIERAYPRFKSKYMTTINMQFGQLKFLTVDYHPDREAQDYVADMVRQVHTLEEQERKIIEELKEQKRYYLGTMFAEKKHG